MKVLDSGKVFAWTDGVLFEEEAQRQLSNLSTLPFVFKHIAVMPDVHAGIGATIGSVVPTRGAIIPAAVGVDIGCGMFAVKTNLSASDLPDNLSETRSEIEKAVPHGRSARGGSSDKGSWSDIPGFVSDAWTTLEPAQKNILDKHPRAIHTRAANQLCSLGTGNHFIEVCLDENQSVWIMLHSGSRGQGNAIGTYFIEKARKEMERWFIHLSDRDLAYLPEGSELFDDYIKAVHWAQGYAFVNRQLMMRQTMLAISQSLGRIVYSDGWVTDCHHNYVARENHFGHNVWVTRKGAVRAREGDFGIIPGSMGAKSFIVRGKGNENSFCSCSHGAGRKMSRTAAKKRFSVEDHKTATSGVECRKDEGVIDETPAAYKDIEAVMAAQSDLIDIVHTLKQVICVKG